MLDYTKLQAIAESAIDNHAYKTWQEEMIAIDEATYYGKNKQLLEVERILDEMTVIGRKPNGVSSPEFTDKLYSVATKLGDIFGFYSLQINNSAYLILSPGLILNAATTSGFTLCHATIIKYTKMMVNGKTTYIVDFDKHHQGIRFKPNARYNMRMFLSVNLFKPSLKNYCLTGGQILAIMLHEIGHNFYVGPVKEISGELISLLSIADLLAFVNSTICMCLSEATADYLDDNMPAATRKGIMNMLGWTADILEIPINVLNAIGLPLNFVINMIILAGLIQGRLCLSVLYLNLAKAFISYDSEKYADSFAAAYGYGPELASALENLNHRAIFRPQSGEQQMVHDFIRTLVELPFAVLYSILDCHPNDQGRLKNNIVYLESCAQNIKDPNLRKEYEENMQAMYIMRDSVKKYYGLNPIKLTNKAAALLQDLIHISDIKDITSTLRPKWIKYANLDYTV